MPKLELKKKGPKRYANVYVVKAKQSLALHRRMMRFGEMACTGRNSIIGRLSYIIFLEI